MGVKGLWTILQPYSTRSPLFELQNKIVAIDLAGWVCEAMCVMNYEVQPRFYLRNLFFRTSYLLLSGVTPVYVLEGTAPPLKFGVICKRLESGPLIGSRPRRIARHNGIDGQTNNPKKAARGRSSFNRILKQCEEMLSYLGVTCVQGPGEAEAFCAYLNKAGMVDGVVSQDSDCFAYGARRVYRNFSVASQGKTAAQGGAVDVYDMDKIEQAMDFGQRKMVAMALLCGCDYCPDGINGVGRDAALKFFSLYAENEVLDRIRAWRTTPDTKFEARNHDRVLCTKCGHAGCEHWRTGCTECATDKSCKNGKWDSERLLTNSKAIKSEVQIRRKALADPDFPSEAIIDEFLVMPAQLPPLDLRWKQPNVVKFVLLMHDSVQWNEAYALAKILPLLTRWQLFHLGNDDTDNDGADVASTRTDRLASMRGSVQPECIKKKRTPKGIASYEILWKDSTGYFDGLVTGMQVQNYLAEHKINDDQAPWSTIEPVDLVERAYPELIEQFFASIQAKKKPVSRRVASVANLDVAQASLPARKRRAQPPKAAPTVEVAQTSGDASTSPLATNPMRPNSKTAAKTPVLIDRFLQRMQSRYVKKSQRKAAFAIGAVPKSPVRPAAELRRRSFLSPRIQTSAQPMNLSQFSFGADDSMTWTEEAADVSDVIREMVNEPPTAISFCGRRLRFEAVLDTSDVCFMAIEPEQADNAVEMETKTVDVANPQPSTSRKSNKETSKKHSDSPRTPKALRGRPVSKFDHKTWDSSAVEAEDPEADPWKPTRIYQHLPFERMADERNDSDVPVEPAVATATETAADESIDEFDRIVLAGNKKGGAFVELPQPQAAYIGTWTHIDSSDKAPSSAYTDDPDCPAPTLQITGDVNAFLCNICSRIDPYNLHQCHVPVLYNGNTALQPPPSSPVACDRSSQDTYEEVPPPQKATYVWGSVQIGHNRLQIIPGKWFKQFVDYWRHFYDHEDKRAQPWHRLWQPPDMAVDEHIEELWAKRMAAATSTPHDRRSRHKRRSYRSTATSPIGYGPGVDVVNSPAAMGGSPHTVSHFFQVADDADLDWHPDDAVDNGATGKVHDDFEACADLWHEPDQFKPSDADVVMSLYDDGTQQQRSSTATAAAAAMEKRLALVARMRCVYGELKRDNCDFEVRLLARGKVNLKGKLMDERPHRVKGRVKGPHAIDGVLMVGAMTPSVLAAERPEVSFRVMPATSNKRPANGAVAGGSKENEAGQSNVERGACNGGGGSKGAAEVATTTAAATMTTPTDGNDSFELNGSYVPVSKKLRNKLDSV